jgi:hypothetical protein
MSSLLHSKLFRRMLVLSVLMTGLLYIGLVKNVKPVHALACCYDCEAGQQACEEACNWGGTTMDDSCPYTSIQDCMNQTGVTFCLHHCSYEVCSGGGCTDSSECGPGCYCTGISCVCF